jgi:hypothetical protein
MRTTGCEQTLDAIKQASRILKKLREPDNRTYSLDIFAAIAMSKPAQGSFRLDWTETQVGNNQAWFSNEDIFRIVKDGENAGYPFKLRMDLRFKTRDHLHYGPVSFARISQGSGGYVGVVSRVVFPNL